MLNSANAVDANIIENFSQKHQKNVSFHYNLTQFTVFPSSILVIAREVIKHASAHSRK